MDGDRAVPVEGCSGGGSHHARPRGSSSPAAAAAAPNHVEDGRTPATHGRGNSRVRRLVEVAEGVRMLLLLLLQLLKINCR